MNRLTERPIWGCNGWCSNPRVADVGSPKGLAVRHGNLRSFCVLVFVLFLGALLPGCAGTVRSPVLKEKSAVRIQGVPVYVQDRYQCGPAALAMVMTWSGAPVSPEALVPVVYSPGLKGSLQPAIVSAARRLGRLAHPLFGVEALYAELATGHPVLVLEDLGIAGWRRWHYSVVVGIDPDDNQILLHGGRPEPERRDLDLFLHSWGRSGFWGLVVLPSGRLPTHGTQTEMLRSISGLEHAGRWNAAIDGYRAVLHRWPQSSEARMGLGNALYGAGNSAGAEAVFNDLCEQKPPYAPGCNNLAHILLESDRRDEALAAARKAVAEGGAMAPVFEETLETILSTRSIMPPAGK